MRRPSGRDLEEGVILELQQLGGYVKATAVDPVTGVEVSVVGSAQSPTSLLKNAAIRKLRYVMENRKGPARVEKGLVV